MSSNVLDTTSQRLEYLINLAGLSRGEFASNIGKHRRTIHSWLTGEVVIRKNLTNFILNFFESRGISCSKEWLEEGIGDMPVKSEIDAPILFDHFNLDYTVQMTLVLYKKSYPHLLHLFVNDAIYVPRLTPQTLLISNPIAQEKFKEEWPHGYLLKNENDQIMPVDIVKKEKYLIATPFLQEGYVPKEYVLSEDERICPIIVNRPIY